jgi:hypothetical protein
MNGSPAERVEALKGHDKVLRFRVFSARIHVSLTRMPCRALSSERWNGRAFSSRTSGGGLP